MVLPPRCIVSGDIVGKQGMVAPAVWAGLNFIGAPQCACCGYPFEFAAEAESLCGGCLRERPDFAAARAALAYDDASREMILKFKHGDHTHAVHTFVPWMERAGQDFLGRANLFVPVPLHRWRLLRRRYNQAGLIAALLARRAGRLFVPDGLVRSRPTESQGHLRFRERHKNVKRAFVVHPKREELLRGKNIVLVDDVYTTGATVKECTKALLAVGAAEVNVLTVTRVLRPDGAD
jgi:ComF family protein